MNLRDLHYLVTIAECSHFGRAAEQCHVSQSTLSIQIKKLEETLDVQLLERNNRHVLLTATGTAIVGRARAILHQAQAIRDLAKAARDPMRGDVSLGAFPTLAPYLFPRCIGAIRQALPGINLHLIEEKTDRLLALLEEGKLDCALIAAPVAQQGLSTIEVFYEPFTLAVPASHPLYRKRSITSAELAGLTLLLLDEGHCLREQALDVCQAIGSGEAHRFRATSLETLRQMVIMNDAVTLMPELAIRNDMAGIGYIPFRNNEFGRTITLCWRDTSARTPLFTRLAEVIALTQIQK